MKLLVYNREKKKKEEELIEGSKALEYLYSTRSGKFLLETFVKRKFMSSVFGFLQDKKSSKKKIRPFIERHNIDESEFLESAESYNTFNEFFVRRLKPEARPIDQANDALVSPADGRVFVYENIDKDKIVEIKGMEFSLEQLLGNRELADEFQGGTIVIVRLCPIDYHRFHFPADGKVLSVKDIDGAYYSVNTGIMDKVENIYLKNKRSITEFQTEEFGKILYLEVGATCVGSIVQTFDQNQDISKGQEKGYFKFGGSTVVLFIQKDEFIPDRDILRNTKNNIETLVKMGETIGRKR